MTGTPTAGTSLTLSQNSQAIVFSDTKITLRSAASIALGNGTEAIVPAGSQVLIPNGTQFTIPGGTATTLLKRKLRPVLYTDLFTESRYNPSDLVQRPYPVKDLDFTTSGAYSVYNWELFFHIPFTIAVHLSKNQRFAEAQHWFHYLFDPTDASSDPTPERFWKVRPFQTTDVQKVEEILTNLVTNSDPELRDETIKSIEAWKNAPFRPHVIARYRQQAYMYKIVMAYLDNLITWGDSLFRQDTGEAIDEAMMLYVLAANILGPRPQPVPKKGTVRPQTYNNLRKDLKQFGTVMREVEAAAPFDLMPFPSEDSGDNARLATLRSLGKALYFCVPRNDKLLSYWDTVADRLFKIRNSLNFQGIFRQLALFEPPIDPALLARATAAGLDVGAIVNGLNQPLPLIRFQLLVQKAAEIVQEVKSLGNNLLTAMEKEDGEAMAILRAKHERTVMEMVEHIKYGQLQEAIKSKENLFQTLEAAVQRFTYYEQQLGKKSDEVDKLIQDAKQALGELEKDSLEKKRFPVQEPALQSRTIEIGIAQSLSEAGGRKLSTHEVQEMTKLKEAHDLNDEASIKDKIAAGLSLLPELGVDFHFWGLGGHFSFGGSALSRGMSFWASFAKTDAEKRTYESGNSSRIGSYSRREQDWTFQSNLAAGEITQIFKQLRAAQIREAIAEQELKNHRQQMKQAEEIERFLNEEGTEKTGKKTNKALYTWMKREVKGLYAQCFQFAFDIARKAERALQHELGNPELSYLQFSYLAGKEGLLAGEKLYLDLKRMEMAYHDLNQREYELTKHVSLLQIDPMALIQLRTTGRCTLQLPEAFFDMDCPGHYFRRIKTVALSIPCITGPYASVNCTLTLLKSSIRTTLILENGGYARIDAEDSRFSDYFGSLQSIVTSSAQNDSGLFEANLRDERYLPFENSGVISEWQLQLPANPSKGEPRQFDYETISDVILHIRYTAREGGGLLRRGAIEQTTKLINSAEAAGSVRLFSIRHEFPGEWAKFQNQEPSENQRYQLTLTLRPEHYPFWSQGRLNHVKQVDVLCRSTQKPIPASLTIADKLDKNDSDAKTDSLTKDSNLGDLLIGRLSNIKSFIKPDQNFQLFLDTNTLSDLWIAVTWYS
ncbi:insecticidal toxin protein [Leptolyngbya sp. FACHB-711]|nr:insecticidal toxin protein [Leptolyngbya sp. FACHB-711]